MSALLYKGLFPSIMTFVAEDLLGEDSQLTQFVLNPLYITCNQAEKYNLFDI